MSFKPPSKRSDFDILLTSLNTSAEFKTKYEAVYKVIRDLVRSIRDSFIITNTNVDNNTNSIESINLDLSGKLNQAQILKRISFRG